MKTLLVNPPTPNIVRAALPPVVEDESGVFPPLGLLYIAAYAEQVDGCTVQVLDCQAEGIGHEDLPRAIGNNAPDVVGIQAMTFTIIDATLVAKAVRRAAPNAFIVFGGPHPTIYPKESAQIPEVDAVIPGEGEYTFPALLRALQAGDDPERVPGVVTKHTLDRPASYKHIEELDELLMPARHLVDSRKYNSPLVANERVTTMMTSRGCPYTCVFCDRPQMGKRFRFRSAKSVVEEMRYCAEDLGIGEILFYDDTFTVNRERVIEICDLLAEEKWGISWDIRARIETMTPEMIEKLREVGCHRIHYGVESGSPRIQKRLKKNLDIDRVHEVFSQTKKAGIETLGYFMIGCPDEERDDIQKTMDLMLSLPMDYVHIAVFTPYPATAVYHEALAEGVYEKDYWREFALDPQPEFTPRYWNECFEDEELLDIMLDAYRKFYSRPLYIVQRLFKVRSFSELARKAKLGVGLLKAASSAGS